MSHDDYRAPEAVARAVRRNDPQLADLLVAECARLREGTAESRLAETELLAAAAPHAPRYRGQFELLSSGLFDQNVTVIEDGDRAHAWVYDDDLVSLDMGRPARSAEELWVHNVAAIESLSRAVSRRVRSIRLCFFEGTARMARALAEHDALDRVTHLDLRLEGKELPAPVARTFPALRGLTCRPSELTALLRDGAPELRSLVVWVDGWNAQVLDAAQRLPKLEHLGLIGGRPRPDDLGTLAAHPITRRLASLDVSATNDAQSFPFDALAKLYRAFEHLRRIDLPGHLVPRETYERVAALLPAAGLVAYDRRETMALDFETIGWGASAR